MAQWIRRSAIQLLFWFVQPQEWWFSPSVRQMQRLLNFFLRLWRVPKKWILWIICLSWENWNCSTTHGTESGGRGSNTGGGGHLFMYFFFWDCSLPFKLNFIHEPPLFCSLEQKVILVCFEMEINTCRSWENRLCGTLREAESEGRVSIPGFVAFYVLFILCHKT
jgi:hypothetical protein